MSFSLDTCIHGAFRGVSEATGLDGKDKTREAYIEYLKSMQYIIQCLLEDGKDLNQSSATSRKKFVQIGLQCMERVATLSDNLAKSLANLPQSQVKGTSGVGNNENFRKMPAGSSSLPVGGQAAAKSQGQPKRSNSVPTPTGGLPPLSHKVKGGSGGPSQLSPMEIAYKQNQLLMEAYRSRISRKQGRGYDPTLSLTIQRKMAENIALAKARQDALDRKIKERQARLIEMAEKRFDGMSEMSTDDLERKQVYTEILEYEHEKKWPLVWRSKLNRTPKDEQLIKTVIQKVLEENDHPLSLLLKKYQFIIYNKLKPLVSTYLERVKKLDSDFHNFLKAQSKSKTSPTKSDEQLSAQDEARECGENEAAEDKVPTEHELETDAEVEASHDSERGPTGICDFGSAFEECKRDVERAINEGNTTVKRLTSVEILDEMDELFEEELENVTEDAEASDGDNQNPLVNQESEEKSINADEVFQNERETCRRHLKDITKDVHIYLDKLIDRFIDCYETPDSDSSVLRDQCHVLLEETFFKKVWPWLIILFRVVHEEEEQKLVAVMKSHYSVSPADVGVRDKWCLNTDAVSCPYKVAIDELGCMVSLQCPLEKLECTVKVTRLICQCVTDFYSDSPNPPALGADDIMPILCYVLLKSNVPQIISECYAMDEFIHEGYLMGEEGYGLTSFQVALNYITSGMSDR